MPPLTLRLYDPDRVTFGPVTAQTMIAYVRVAPNLVHLAELVGVSREIKMFDVIIDWERSVSHAKNRVALGTIPLMS